MSRTRDDEAVQRMAKNANRTGALLYSPGRRLSIGRPQSPSVTVESGARQHPQSPTQWNMQGRDIDLLLQSTARPRGEKHEGGRSNQRVDGNQRASNAIRTLQFIAQGKQHIYGTPWAPSPGRGRGRPFEMRDGEMRGMSQSPVMGLEGRAVRGSGSWPQPAQQHQHAALVTSRHSWQAASGTPIRMSQRRLSHREREREATDTWRTGSGSSSSSPFPGASPRSPLSSPLYTRAPKSPRSDAHRIRDAHRNTAALDSGTSKDSVQSAAAPLRGGKPRPPAVGTRGAAGGDSPGMRRDVLLRDLLSASAPTTDGAALRDVLHPRVAKIRQFKGSARRGGPAAVSAGGRIRSLDADSEEASGGERCDDDGASAWDEEGEDRADDDGSGPATPIGYCDYDDGSDGGQDGEVGDEDEGVGEGVERYDGDEGDAAGAATSGGEDAQGSEAEVDVDAAGGSDNESESGGALSSCGDGENENTLEKMIAEASAADVWGLRGDLWHSGSRARVRWIVYLNP
jgi:hypothetical protein